MVFGDKHYLNADWNEELGKRAWVEQRNQIFKSTMLYPELEAKC